MRRLVVICEGPTEQEFCNDLLRGYFRQKDVWLDAPTIKHSHGGIVAWDTLKRQIVGHLHEGDCVVSMLVDYYRIKDSYGFPGWRESKGVANPYDKMRFLFRQMLHDLDGKFRARFVPYIQLHEFEGLLFSDISVFARNFTDGELNFRLLKEAVACSGSPEEINNGPATAPSERLKRAVKGYDKVVYGACLAAEIGLEAIRERCVLFREWLERLETACVG